MPLRPSVLEQSTQYRSGAGPVFGSANFPGSNVKPVAKNGTHDHVPMAAPRSQGLLILIHFPSKIATCQNLAALHSTVSTQ